MNSSSNKEVVTDRSIVFRYDLEKCPRGQKVQLLCAGGVAQYGTYTGKEKHVYAWSPLPVRDKAEEARRGIADLGYYGHG